MGARGLLPVPGPPACAAARGADAPGAVRCELGGFGKPEEPGDRLLVVAPGPRGAGARRPGGIAGRARAPSRRARRAIRSAVRIARQHAGWVTAVVYDLLCVYTRASAGDAMMAAFVAVEMAFLVFLPLVAANTSLACRHEEILKRLYVGAFATVFVASAVAVISDPGRVVSVGLVLTVLIRSGHLFDPHFSFAEFAARHKIIGIPVAAVSAAMIPAMI